MEQRAMLEDLSVYRGLMKDPVMQALMSGSQGEAIGHLAVFAEENGICGGVLRHYAANIMALDDNMFSKTAELTGECGKSLWNLSKQDIGCVMEFLEKFNAILPDYIPTHPAAGKTAQGFSSSLLEIADSLLKSAEEAVKAFFAHYKKYGRGIAAKYNALGWGKDLRGIGTFDKTGMDDLIGIEQQKEMLIENTRRFLQHRGAQNVLLYGDSGTGKSSIVKALVNQYCVEGLRLLELKKNHLADLERISEKLGQSMYRYIVFLDDLSFEEGELGYKILKEALEGKAAQMPENVLFYATSNRRHLVKEVWSDRAVAEEDVHISDTVQEKLSLSDRFGLRIAFLTPALEQYLEIVKELCRKQEFLFDEELKDKAVQWTFYNGRTGRSAKQFVGTLT